MTEACVAQPFPILHPTCTYMWMTVSAHITLHLLLPACGTIIFGFLLHSASFLSLELPLHLYTISVLSKSHSLPSASSVHLPCPGLLFLLPLYLLLQRVVSEDPPPHALQRFKQALASLLFTL